MQVVAKVAHQYQLRERAPGESYDALPKDIAVLERLGWIEPIAPAPSESKRTLSRLVRGKRTKSH